MIVLRAIWRCLRALWRIWTLAFGPLLTLDVLFLVADGEPMSFIHTSWSSWLWLLLLPWTIWTTVYPWKNRKPRDM